jgi:ankyrin repeat protein
MENEKLKFTLMTAKKKDPPSSYLINRLAEMMISTVKSIDAEIISNQEKTRRGFSDLIVAIKEGRTAAVQNIVENYPEQLKECDNTGGTALYHACKHNRYEIVDILLQTKPSLACQKAPHENIFVYALFTCTVTIVEKLYAYSVESNQQKFLRFHPRIYSDLLACHDDDRKQSTFLFLARNGHMFSELDDQGYTLLHAAVHSRDVFVAHLILETNSTLVNVANERRVTALHIAACKNDIEMVQILLMYGADPTAKWVDCTPSVGEMGKVTAGCLSDDVKVKQLLEYAEKQWIKNTIRKHDSKESGSSSTEEK